MSEHNGAYRQDILGYAKEKYGTAPESLWLRYPNYAVLRHADNEKWYAVIMDVAREKVGLTGKDKVDILEVKCDPLIYGSLLSEEGLLPAYHMKKGGWLTVLLDGTVDREKAFALLRMSFELTSRKPAKKKRADERSE